MSFPPSAEEPIRSSETATDLPPTTIRRSGAGLPPTSLLWFVILIASFLLPPLFHVLKITQEKASTSEYALSTSDFQDYLQAEVKTRSGFAGDILGDLGGSQAKQRKDFLSEAEASYRDLSVTTGAPNMARRALILHNALGKPFDDTLITKQLSASLKQNKTDKKDIEQEQTLWRALYREKHIPPADPFVLATRIRAMHLNFLENRALADLYRAAGDTRTAARYDAALQAKADANRRSLLLLVVTMGLGAIVGLLLLIVFCIAAGRREWNIVGRQASAPLKMGWGDLMDAFLFYLAIFKLSSALMPIVLDRSGKDLNTHDRMLVLLVLEVALGAVGFAYVHAAARRRGTTLADIGLTLHGKPLVNLLYGIAAYTAAMPLIFGAGLITQLIFNKESRTTPNPILPLLVGQHDLFGKVIIFLLASIYAPIFEEFFFRGVLYTGLRAKYSWTAAATISAFVFALLHPPHDWIAIFVLGFALATARELRQSLFPGMVMHFIQNSLTFLYIAFLFR